MPKDLNKFIFSATIDKKDWIKTYLKIFNGNFKLTDTELKVTEGFITIYLEMIEKGVDSYLINEIAFNKKNRKFVRAFAEIETESSFNNCISSLKKKGVIVKKEEDLFEINQILIPVKSLTFNFKFKEDASI